MKIKIKGQIQKGLNIASSFSLPMQKPHLQKYIKNINSFYMGTINLLLERPLIIFNPDIVTDRITWTNGPSEPFGFLNIEFETIPKKEQMPIDALIYIAYGSVHYPNPFYQEILAPQLDLSKVEFCKIIINKRFKETSAIVI